MPNVVNFEDENGEDANGALREAIQAVAKVNWDDNDLRFVFKKLEIAIAAAGAKKQYTKFQVISTILPKHVEDEVKLLLEMQETEFTDNNAYKQLKSLSVPGGLLGHPGAPLTNLQTKALLEELYKTRGHGQLCWS